MNYYFLGIGGIGMSALARFFKQRGDVVSGYDRTPSPLTSQLEAEGIAIHYTDSPALIPANIDLVVYTPAIPHDTAEFQHLVQLGIPMRKRSQVLGELTLGKRCVAVAGTHGKTTTSSMIAHLLQQSHVGCSAFLGGICKNFESNMIVNPSSPYVVVEADEYDRSFLQLHPYYSVITATAPDHLDIYGTHHHLLDAFAQYANQTDPQGMLFLKQGSFLTEDSTPYQCELSVPLQYSYSAHENKVDYFPSNIQTAHGDIFFDLHTPQMVYPQLQLHNSCLYNVENAVAASAVALACGLTEQELRQGLASFAGVKRRFDYHLNTPSLVYIDDYAHHPEEISATLTSIRHLFPNKRVVGIFQPHLYSRTRDFADGFAAALDTLDEVILMPIYPAREEPIPGVTSDIILQRLSTTAKYLCTPDQVLSLLPTLQPDVVVTLGAGDIDRLVLPLEQTLRNYLNTLK